MRGLTVFTLCIGICAALPYPELTEKDVVALFKRQDRQYPPVHSIPDRSMIPQEWLDRLASISLPNIPISTDPGHTGRPEYAGFSATSTEVCSFTYECDHPDDLKTPPAGVVAMTFDDGPAGGSEALWNYLGTVGGKGQFTHFMIGSYIRNNPDMFSRIASEGGHIAVHTWSHNYMTTLTNEQVVAELGWNMQIISDLSDGRVPMYWRPPFGDVDNRVRAIAKGVFGLETVTWSQDTGDWNLDQGRDTSVESIQRVYGDWLGDKSRGLNVLHHEVRESQADAFKSVFPSLTGGWEVKNIADAWGKPWYQNAADGNSTVQPMSVGQPAPSLSPSSSASPSAASSTSPSSTSASVDASSPPASSTSPELVASAGTSASAARPSSGATTNQIPFLAALLGVIGVIII